jgi:16S rRNA processing protein RimM
MKELIEIGRLGQPRGLRGEIWFTAYGNDPAYLLKLDSFLFENTDRRNGQQKRTLKLSKGRLEATRLMLKFDGIDSREAAEELRGGVLFIKNEDLPELEDGENYISDLIGMEARLEDGRYVGQVVDLMEIPAYHVYVIKHDEFEALIPSIKEFVSDVCLEKRIVTIRPLDGMLPEGMLKAEPDEN